MKAKTKLLVILSDLHVGSSIGLWPPGFVSTEGFSIGQNKFQYGMWQHWQACQKWIAKITGGNEYELLLNGDLVEGIHHRSLQVMSPDVADQVTAAVSVLGPIAQKSKSVYLTKGTECHTGNLELHIGKEIGATVDKSTGHYAFDRLELDFNGVIFSASHHCSSASKPWLESGEYSKFISAEIIEAGRCKRAIPQIVAKAHRHVGGVFDDGTSIGVVTGAWQGLTRHGNKVVSHAIPRSSCVILDFRLSEKGDLPTVHTKTFIQ